MQVDILGDEPLWPDTHSSYVGPLGVTIENTRNGESVMAINWFAEEPTWGGNVTVASNGSWVDAEEGYSE